MGDCRASGQRQRLDLALHSLVHREETSGQSETTEKIVLCFRLVDSMISLCRGGRDKADLNIDILRHG